MSKSQMIATLGEKALLLPDLVSRALSANDRVKYLLTLLQSARAAADGDANVSDLHEDRVASGVSDLALDRVVHTSARREMAPTRSPAPHTFSAGARGVRLGVAPPDRRSEHQHVRHHEQRAQAALEQEDRHRDVAPVDVVQFRRQVARRF